MVVHQFTAGMVAPALAKLESEECVYAYQVFQEIYVKLQVSRSPFEIIDMKK